MAKKVTLGDTKAMLLSLAEQFPDRSVVQCTYALDNQPNCIVGEALARWGVPIDVLVAMDNRRFELEQHSVTPYVELTEDAARLLQIAQSEQDEEDDNAVVEDDGSDSRHVPWRRAVSVALSRMDTEGLG